MSTLAVAQLLFLEAENPKKEISCTSTRRAACDVGSRDLRYHAVHPSGGVHAVHGQAASMGSLLLTAGEKGLRFALPNARIMVHQPSGGFQGQVTDIMLHAQEILSLKKR